MGIHVSNTWTELNPFEGYFRAAVCYCTETEEDHRETLSIMEWAGYDYAYMFKYSERPGTLAARKYPDDIPEEVKSRRLTEIIDMQKKLSLESNKRDIGITVEVLIESISKRSEDHLSGRSSEGKVVVFPKKNFKPGDYVHVKITDCTGGTLIGEVL